MRLRALFFVSHLGFTMTALPRKSYTASNKLRVLDHALAYGSSVACRVFGIDASMLCRWRQRGDVLRSADGTCRRVGRPGRPVTFPVLEQVLYKWVMSQRRLHIPVTYGDIQQKMLELVQHNHNHAFKASNTWLSGFLKRHHLSLRTSTCLRSSTARAESEVLSRLVCIGRDIHNAEVSFSLPNTLLFLLNDGCFHTYLENVGIGDKLGANAPFSPVSDISSPRIRKSYKLEKLLKIVNLENRIREEEKSIADLVQPIEVMLEQSSSVLDACFESDIVDYEVAQISAAISKLELRIELYQEKIKKMKNELVERNTLLRKQKEQIERDLKYQAYLEEAILRNE